jgi:hypothetical protein
VGPTAGPDILEMEDYLTPSRTQPVTPPAHRVVTLLTKLSWLGDHVLTKSASIRGKNFFNSSL